MHIWDRSDWPHFRWQDDRLLEKVAATRLKQGRLLGSMARLDARTRAEAQIDALTEEALASCEIEGDSRVREPLRATIAHRLGADGAPAALDHNAESVVGMILNATENHAAPLTAARLFGWQVTLFPSGYSSRRKVTIGAWRDDGMASFATLPAVRLDAETRRFLDWFERRTEPEGLLRAGLAHLWFAMLSPFDDGNGRMARAIADLALAQSEGSGQRFYSLSAQIRDDRAAYLDRLERARSGGLDVTEWLVWFVDCLDRALDRATAAGAEVLRKADFWQRYAREPLSQRQKTILERYLKDLNGRPTARNWAALGRCSIPTAQRDINDLVARNILRRNEGGSKNTSYRLIAG